MVTWRQAIQLIRGWHIAEVPKATARKLLAPCC